MSTQPIEKPPTLETQELYHATYVGNYYEEPGSGWPADLCGYHIYGWPTKYDNQVVVPLRYQGYLSISPHVYKGHMQDHKSGNDERHPLDEINTTVRNFFHNARPLDRDILDGLRTVVEGFRQVLPKDPEEPSEIRSYLGRSEDLWSEYHASERLRYAGIATRLSGIIAKHELWIIGTEENIESTSLTFCEFRAAPLRGLVSTTQGNGFVLRPLVQNRHNETGFFPLELAVPYGVSAPADL